jgi:aspartate/methionine/tyrosine aminotransferase
VTTPDLASTLTLSLIPALETAFNTSTHPIKGLLISNPHNPLGQCYPLEVLQACMKFCKRKNIHYISDEVYGMTKFACEELSSSVPFISALSIDVESLGVDLGRVHTIWSTSKDFGQSGVRMVSQLLCVSYIADEFSHRLVSCYEVVKLIKIFFGI